MFLQQASYTPSFGGLGLIESDDTSLDSYVNYPELATVQPTLTQQDYRWYANIDGVTPTTPLALENTSTTGATPGSVFRLRLNVEAAGVDLPTGAQAFKLQFAATTTGPWTDVGAPASTTIWRGVDNPAPADGTTLPSLLLSSSNVLESYEEANPSVPNPNALLATSTNQGEWDWVIEDKLAPTGTFYFRMVKSDGIPLDGYTNYPEIEAAGPSLAQEDYRWYLNADSATPTTTLGAENTPFTTTTQLAAFRLRMNLEVSDSAVVAGAESFKLQYSVTTTGSWTDVGGLGSNEEWRALDNASVADGSTLPGVVLASSTVAGTYEEENPTASNPNTIGIGDRAEWDWVLQPVATLGNTTYYFRMVRGGGTPLETYTNYPAITTPPPLVLTQRDYRWYTNSTTSTTPTNPLADENVAHTGATPEDVFRLRMNVGLAGADLSSGVKQFNLQFAATTTGPWTDVGGLPVPIQLDAASTDTGSGGSNSLTISHTVGDNPDRILVVGTEGEDNNSLDCNVTGVTYGGVALTKIDNAITTASSFVCVSLWYLTAPAVGTDDIVVTWAGNVSRRIGGGTSIYNAAQQAPESKNSQFLNSASTISTDVSTLTDGAWVIDAVGASGNALFTTTTAGQIIRYNTQSGASAGAGSTKHATVAGTVTMGWSQAGGRKAQVVAAFAPASAASTARIWRAFDNTSLTDGDTLSTILLSTSTVAQTYEEANPTAANPNAMAIGDVGEWDWVVQDNGASTGDFYFRMIEESGAPLSVYVGYPKITTAAPDFDQKDYRWYMNVDGASATSTWRTLPDTPAQVQFGGALTTDGTDFYAFRGGNTAEFWKFDPNVGGWIRLTDAPGLITDGGALEHANGFIYAFQGGTTANFWRYDVASGVWDVLTSAPQNVDWGGALKWDGDDRIYAFRGGVTTDFWAYSIAGNSWSVLVPAPQTVEHGGSLEYVSSTIYGFRGNNNNAFWSYTTSTGWTTLTNAPSTVEEGGSLAWDGGNFLYALRGDNNTAFWRYDLSATSSPWQVLQSTPAPVDDGGALIFLNDAFYAFEGDNADSFWVFGPAPVTPLADENTPIVADGHGVAYRLRMNVEITVADMATSTESFKLQYSTTTSAGPWADVGAVASGETWRGFDNPSVADGTTIEPILSSSTVGQSYEEGNPSVANPRPGTATSTERSEWDWTVEGGNAAPSTVYFFRMVSADGTSFADYTAYPRITSPPAIDLSQENYRWYENRTNITPNTPLQLENTPHTGVLPLEIIRLRMNVKLTGTSLAAGSESFKLQFSTSTSGGWQDVGGLGSGDVWRGSLVGGGTTIDGATIPILLLASSTVAATFEESNPSASIPNGIADGEFAEWDWVVQDNTAPTDTYYFRMVTEDGTPLAGYSASYPEVTTAGPTFSQEDYQWFLNVDNRNPTFALGSLNTPYTEASSPGVIRLRMNVEVQNGTLPDDAQAFKLQFAVGTTTAAWTDVGDIGSLTAWRGFDNPSVNESILISAAKLASTDVRENYEEENPSILNSNQLTATQRGEWDWVIQNNSAPTETTFYFRMVKADGTPLDAYANYPEVQTTKPVVAADDFESGGFSGGVGWVAAWNASGDASVRSNGGPIQGSFHLRLRAATGHADRVVDLSGEVGATLSFWAKARSFEGSETATVSVSDDGVSFTVLKTWVIGDDDNVYYYWEFDLTTFPEAFTNNYTIAFDANMGATNDRIYFDDIRIIGD